MNTLIHEYYVYIYVCIYTYIYTYSYRTTSVAYMYIYTHLVYIEICLLIACAHAMRRARVHAPSHVRGPCGRGTWMVEAHGAINRQSIQLTLPTAMNVCTT